MNRPDAPVGAASQGALVENQGYVVERGDRQESEDTAKGKGRCCAIGSYALGVVMILCVAVIWTYASVLIQYIFSGQSYEKPFFMTYFNTAVFAVNNIGFLLLESWRSLPWKNEKECVPLIVYDDAVKKVYEGRVSEPDNTGAGEEGAGHGCESEDKIPPLRPYSKYRLFKCAFLFCPIWFVANSLFNLSLSKTSVASVTVLSTTSGIWTFIISLIFFGQRFTAPCVLAILFSVGGAAMVAFSDATNKENETIEGDIYSLLSAMSYAVYTSVIKWHASDDDRYSIIMLFAFVGALNTILFWPFVLTWHYTDFERFELPNPTQFGLMLLNALVGTNLSEVLWARAVLLTSPVVATLGLTLTTPLAMTSDILIKGKGFNVMYIFGAVFLTMGFILINLDGQITRLWRRCVSPRSKVD